MCVCVCVCVCVFYTQSTFGVLIDYIISAVPKSSFATEMRARSEHATSVVYESINEGRLQPDEVLTENPLYPSVGTVETNPAYGVTTGQEQSE